MATLPNETVIDGEIVALDSEGRPSFSLLQNYGSGKTPVMPVDWMPVFTLAGLDAAQLKSAEPLWT